ncbi:MAG: WYL domain-containing protein, partial [Mycobacteriaceae bacterium]|nr:WYL domain-containing protein [Mycobacteriaceae bacterium]
FDRIVDARMLDEPAAPPQPVVDAPPNTALFDADPALPAATLRIAPRVAWMLEYFPMRVLKELPDGFREVAMTYAAEEWMARLILGFGADVQALAPDSLVARVRQAAAEALAAYDHLG